MIMRISQRKSLRRQLDDDKVRRIFHLRSIRGLRYESHLGAASPPARKIADTGTNVFGLMIIYIFWDVALSSASGLAVDSNSDLG